MHSGSGEFTEEEEATGRFLRFRWKFFRSCSHAHHHHHRQIHTRRGTSSSNGIIPSNVWQWIERALVDLDLVWSDGTLTQILVISLFRKKISNGSGGGNVLRSLFANTQQQRHGRTLYVVPIRMCMLMRRRRERCPLSVPPSVVEYMPRLRSGDGGGGLIKGIKNHNWLGGRQWTQFLEWFRN